ncbi:MAG: VWA domain-containing protein [Planctomycetota bacterium]|nr:VWA domain-containing protein [Planctomycetota bacterium]
MNTPADESKPAFLAASDITEEFGDTPAYAVDDPGELATVRKRLKSGSPLWGYLLICTLLLLGLESWLGNSVLKRISAGKKAQAGSERGSVPQSDYESPKATQRDKGGKLMDSSQLLFSPAINWFVLGSVGLAVFIYLFLSYRSIRAAVGAKTAMGLAAFKLLLVVLLVMCLVQPVASMERRLKGQGAVAVLLDTSGSMAVEDSLAGKARIEAALDLLVRDTALLKALAEDFSIATFRFERVARGTCRWHAVH